MQHTKQQGGFFFELVIFKVRALTYSIDVRWKSSQRLPPVQLDGVGAVQIGDVIVRIHSYQDVGHIRLEEVNIQV